MKIRTLFGEHDAGEFSEDALCRVCIDLHHGRGIAPETLALAALRTAVRILVLHLGQAGAAAALGEMVQTMQAQGGPPQRAN